MNTGEPVAAQTGLRVPCLHNPGRDDLTAQLQSQGFVWIDLEGPTDEDLDKLGKLITLAPGGLADARHVRPQRRPNRPSCRGWRPTTGRISVTSTTR